MALPSSGSLSLSQIGQELGQGASNLSLRNLSAMAEFSPSDSISEFYGFSAGGGGGGGDFMIMYSFGILNDPCTGMFVDVYQDRRDGMYYYSKDGKTMIPCQGENIYFFEYEDIYSGWYYYNLIRFDGYKERWLGTWESQCPPS